MRVIMIFPLMLLLFANCNDISFNSAKWKNWGENESNMHMRWDMTGDLIKNYTLKEKSIMEIEQLLGKIQDQCSTGDCTVYYDLGPCRSGIDYGSLMIQFKKGKVYRIEKHCN